MNFALAEMNQPIPPPIPPPVHRTKGKIGIAALLAAICLLLVLVPIVGSAIMGVSIFSWPKAATEIRFKSYTDKFQIEVLEMKAEPNYFMERVRVRCERDMEAKLRVADIREAGLFETHGPDGKTYYREGQPDKIRDSVLARASGSVSFCEMMFKVTTTPTNTVWHSRMSAGTTNVFGHSENSGGVDTTLAVPLTVSGIETNWPGSYERGSSIPLANLGAYKILLSIK